MLMLCYRIQNGVGGSLDALELKMGKYSICRIRHVNDARHSSAPTPIQAMHTTGFGVLASALSTDCSRSLLWRQIDAPELDVVARVSSRARNACRTVVGGRQIPGKIDKGNV